MRSSALHARLREALVFVGLVFAALLLGVAGSASPAFAHAFAPALLELREVSTGRVEVRFKQPSVRAAGSSLRPVLPESCRADGPPAVTEEGTGLVAAWPLACDGELVGATLGVSGIAGSQADVLVRVELLDGRSIRRILTQGEPSMVVPEREGTWDVLAAYGVLGFEHILGGFDHLLFVLGLVLLVGRGRRLLAVVTAFTLGHSVTLALASLGLVHVPQAPVEALIAFSIYVLAVELTRPAEKRWSAGGSFAVAAGFGLLHGLGFAGALSEAGLPRGEVPAALFAFNVGIEVGQLAFVAAVLLLAASLARVATTAPRRRLLERAVALPVYGIGILAAYWTCERLVAAWGFLVT